MLLPCFRLVWFSFCFGLLKIMSACMSKKIQTQTQGLSSSLKIEEETMLVQKQGIVTIAAASSLRRTLSADMSSKKWLSQNEPSPMKKTASSEQLSHSADSSLSSSEGEEDDYDERKELEAKAAAEAEADRERLEIWSTIQRNKKEEQEKAGQFDTWSSIMSLKANDEISKSLPAAPYIHPLVKRSKSSLSEKSLEICTESLGSETGSDGFSSYPPSETGDVEEDDKEEDQNQNQHQQTEKVTEQEYEAEEEELELQVPKYNYATKKSTPRAFPPPLTSLSHRQDGPSLHMRPHRDNGRLVLQAVSVPLQNNFCVQRQDGRLVLTFANHHEVAEKEEKDRMEELEEEEFGQFEEDYDQEEKEHEEEDEDDEIEECEEEVVGEIESDNRDVQSVIGQAPLLSSGITSTVHGLAVMINEPIGLVNRNPKWSEKFNEVVNFENVNVVEQSPVAKSLPPRPRVARGIPSSPAAGSSAAAASFNFNAYEYFWKAKTEQNNNSPLKNNNSGKLIVSGDINQTSNEQQQLLVFSGKNGDYLVHNLKSCKVSRRSFLFWEPCCIATS